MGNYSKDPATALQTALSKGYSRVRFQQGKPILDRELNLAADLAGCERLAQQYIGDGVPAGSAGFQITGLNTPTGDFSILPGTCRVGGLEIVLANPTTYRTQPNTGLVGPLPAGSSSVYLHVFTGRMPRMWGRRHLFAAETAGKLLLACPPSTTRLIFFLPPSTPRPAASATFAGRT